MVFNSPRLCHFLKNFHFPTCGSILLTLLYCMMQYRQASEVAMQIRIVAGSNAALYKQIADQISRSIAAGELQVGQMLPSVRQLARELVINPNTVAKAYADLVQAGIVETQAAKGFFVSKRRQVYTKTERLRRLDESIQSLINQSLTLGFSADEVLDRVRELFGKVLRSLPDSSS